MAFLFRHRSVGMAFVTGSATFAAIFAAPLATYAQQSPPAAVQATGVPAASGAAAITRATWDNNFVYFVVQVDDGDVLGTASRPLSPDVPNDDGVGVYFQTGTERPQAPNAQTHAMLVSTAGGFQFLQGDVDKKTLIPLPLFSIKYGVSVQGTLNRSDDRDKGYTISLAVPLSALGLDSKTIMPGTELGFNLVIRSRSGKGIAASALSGSADSPTGWTKLVLAAPDAQAAGAGGAVIAPRVGKDQSAPSIDGVYRPSAWPETSRFVLTLPESVSAAPVAIAPAAPLPTFTADTTAPEITNPTLFKQGVTPFVFARYLLAYQGDRRKMNVPTRAVWGKGDTLLLTDQPITGVGPWFSFDRVSYHKTQMTEMRRAGIDVALTQIGGPNAPLGTTIMDSKALLVLVAAIREMEGEGTPAPRLALMLDTSALTAPAAPAVDLTKPEGRELVYRAIKRWFDLVPPELRAKATLRLESGASAAFPVFFTGGDGTQLTLPPDAEWADDLRKRFAQDFGPATNGTTLIFVGGKGASAAPGLVASLPSGGMGGASSGGPLGLFVVQPNGADSTSTRKEGESYTQSWEAAFAAKPDWVVVDSWNDFTRGTEIAPSRQYGPHFADLTRILTVQATGLPPYAVNFPSNDVPKRMRPGQVVNTTLLVQNAGGTPLRGTDGISMVYRWKKGNTIVGENPLPLPLPGTLFPTQSARLPVGLLAAQVDTNTGKFAPLEPGDYTVEFDVSRTSKTENDGKPISLGNILRLPVTISPTLPDAVEFGSSTLSPLLATGGTYPVTVRLRWMGDKPLGLDEARLVYQLQSEDGKTTILSGSLSLNQPLSPGQWETVSGPMQLVDGGSPIAPACPELVSNGGPSGYRLRWLLTRINSTEAVPGERVETVAVYPETDEARITPPPPPGLLKAGDLQNMPVTVTNQGQTTWKKGDFSVGCHWYYADGAEASWKPDVFASLDHDIKPGESVKVTVPVRVPDRDGDFILAFDVLRAPDIFLSTRPISRSGDMGLIPVRVLGGSLVFADLTKLFDVDGVSGEDDRARTGDLDGKGDAFPVESFPPDPFGIVAYLSGRDGATGNKTESHPTAYPSGYYSDFSPSARLVGFRYGVETLKSKNAVSCNGQTVPVPQGKYFGLHIAVLATGGKELPLTLTLHYKDGTTTSVTRPVGDWNTLPTDTGADATPALIALQTRTMRSQKNGDLPTPCVLRHIVVSVSAGKELDSVVLPTNANIKVFAITLEK